MIEEKKLEYKHNDKNNAREPFKRECKNITNLNSRLSLKDYHE